MPLPTVPTVQVLRGLAANLPSSAPVGTLLFTTDTQKLYVGTGTGIALIGGGAGGVSQIIAGTNITISPSGGTGAVTINASSGEEINFADDETVSGSGTSWTLANSPAAGCVPQLFVEVPSFGLIGLLEGSAATYGYTISGASITTVSSYTAGTLHAWYRY